MNEKLLSLIKLLCITYLIIFLPHVISKEKSHNMVVQQQAFNPSVDNLITNKQFKWIKKLKIAVLSNKKIIFSSNAKNYKKLLKNGLKIKNLIFINKNLPADVVKQINIKTTFWNTKTDLKPLVLTQNFDAILLDIQGSSLTFDKPFKILKKTMSTLSGTNKRLIVLDKPNPAGPVMEGPGKIPLRHGLTIGELAKYLNTYSFNKKVKLTIIPMQNWNRNHKCYFKKDQKIAFEKKVLKIIGQLKPIKQLKKRVSIALPKGQQLSKWEQNYLTKLCFKAGIYSKGYLAIDKKMSGIEIIKLIKDIKNFSVYNTVLTIVRFLNNRKNINLQFTNNFNKMLGSDDTKNYLNGKITLNMLKQRIEKNLIDFKTAAKKIMLYGPHPRMKQVKLIRM